MRVCQVVADGRPGGGTVIVLALIEALVERGIEAALITQPDSYAARQALDLGAQVSEVDLFSFVGGSSRLSRALDALESEVVHVHGSRAGHHAAAWSRQRPEATVHYTVHGYHFHHRAWPRRALGRFAERRVGKQLRSVVHVCDYDYALAKRWGLVAGSAPRKVIYNGVDAETLPAPAPLDPPRVVFVGRLVPQKDPVLITEITRRLADERIGVTIVGGGEDEPEVRRSLAGLVAQGRVDLVGAVDRERALGELATASVLVLPSRWEGLPVALLEALAMGVPAVAADVGGIREVLGEGGGGFLVADRDAASFVAPVLELVRTPELRQRLGEAGRQRIAERFTLARCMAGYLELYGCSPADA